MPTKHGPKLTLQPRLARIPSMLAGSQAQLQSAAEVTTQSPADPKISKVPRTSQNPPECHGQNCTPASSGTAQNLFRRESPMDAEGLLQACMTWEMYAMGDSLPLLLKPSFCIESDHSPMIKREKQTLLSRVRSSYRVTGNPCILSHSSRSSSSSWATKISLPCTFQ